MAEKLFTLDADIRSDDPGAIAPVLEARFAREAITRLPDGFKVLGVISGESAQDLNRALLSDLRRAVRKTRLRATWSDGDVTERFFDYVRKGRLG